MVRIRVVNMKDPDVLKHWNRKTQMWDDHSYVYVGRQDGRYGLPQSPLANTFRLGKDNITERMAAIDNFKKYTLVRPTPQVRRELERIMALLQRGVEVKLICWCAPHKLCHAEAIAEWLRQHVKVDTGDTGKQEVLF